MSALPALLWPQLLLSSAAASAGAASRVDAAAAFVPLSTRLDTTLTARVACGCGHSPTLLRGRTRTRNTHLSVLTHSDPYARFYIHCAVSLDKKIVCECDVLFVQHENE